MIKCCTEEMTLNSLLYMDHTHLPGCIYTIGKSTPLAKGGGSSALEMKEVCPTYSITALLLLSFAIIVADLQVPENLKRYRAKYGGTYI